MENIRLRPAPVEPPPHRDDAEPSPYCPRFQFAVELVGRRWVGAIMRRLGTGPARFNEILGAIPGLSDRLLTERLRELEQHGILARTVETGRPIRVTYELTPCGRSLDAIVAAIGDWSERWVELGPLSS
jgi:DNA-binding HxlR family transcriptional regulator